jgi:hypothetical protein
MNPIGGLLIADQDNIAKRSGRCLTLSINLTSLGNYLNVIDSRFIATPMFICDSAAIGIPTPYSRAKSAGNEMTPYSIFYKKMLRFGINDESEIQNAYIKNNKIDYLIVSKNYQLDQSLRKRISNEIIDSVSGERFVLLDTL